MATVDDLPNTPLSGMSEDELMKRLLEIRHERRVNLDKKPVAKAASASSPRAKRQPKQTTMQDVMMSVANDNSAKAALIAMLEKELNK